MQFSDTIIILLAVPSSSLQPNITVVHGPWAEILENWITLQSNNSRVPRVIKINDKNITVSTKIAASNKREVSETDLYLLGTTYEKFKRDYLDNFNRRYNL